MNDPLPVRGAHSIGQCKGKIEEMAELQPGFREQLRERLSPHQLHRDEVDALVLLDREHGDDVGMVERSNGFGLALESHPTVFA